MPYQYGEMFDRLRVPGMGRRGAGWCGIDASGTLVIMSHQNFFRRENGALVYRHPGDPRAPHVSASASRSVRLIADYYELGKPVLLPVGVFSSDGGWHPDGTHIPSKFSYATGDVYRARFREFNADTMLFICDVLEKFTI